MDGLKDGLKIGFIGFGLIGGSIAKALRASLPDVRIIVYDVNKATLEQALREGVANQAVRSIDISFSGCNYIFLCAPVSINDENLITLKQFLSPSCTLTDVGSVKGGIHRHIEALGLSAQFIGGHPMAGSERFGYSNSKARLLDAIPLVLDAAQHDFVTAAISHLPHIIASSLVNLVKESDSPDGTMKMVAAGGFKDITRIASSSPDMWQQICLTNTDNIVRLLENYIQSLSSLKETLSARDASSIYRFFDGARVYRDSFIGTSSGPIKKSFSITVDIADETGALATVATILARQHIGIKNIGIVHNRELAEGALRIEFYEENAIKTAADLLKSRGYTVFL